ncbi:AAA family ATPase [Pelovirga terrestris]|uniref:AAA family ATPase n=1 Tax=Pelovirga terrestris TaxID=2771352 RepID=A0A8J6R5V9_9BACT|nr:bifunctional aminoglycoside phosphotransferase/ATP-binding protein [Pelovirga terrestris]MBD1400704.1 AAA family ATPase [Pelovirga terrestris]
MEKHRQLVKHMLKPCFFGSSNPAAELIETHASWIFLSGDYAYKMKKPVNFGFLDFSSPAKRHFFCTEELRLNRRVAPELYLAVIPVGGSINQPRLNREPALAYLVKMRRFPQENQLDRMLAAGTLDVAVFIGFAEKIAHVHSLAPQADRHKRFGTPESIIEPVRQNFAQIKSSRPDNVSLQSISTIEEWSESTFVTHQPVLLRRREEGFIRECHGDMHLANMAWFQGRPLLFDCIEFNENLRWIDTINDIAFLVMDLDARGQHLYAWAFLNTYLRHTGDYAGLKVLHFYQTYRAMVRAKVLGLRLGQPNMSDRERRTDLEQLDNYLTLAENYTQPTTPRLIITHGLSGSGKTTFVNELAPHIGAICIHSDLERKRLYHLEATQSGNSGRGKGIYSTTANNKTYDHLNQLATIIIDSGFSVIVDATFIRHADRRQIAQLATSRQYPLNILDFQLHEGVLRRRIKQRLKQGGSLSDADEKVLACQLTSAEPLTAAEQDISIVIDEQTDVKSVGKQVEGGLNC